MVNQILNLEDYVERKVIRFMGPGSAYNYISMAEAIKDSGLEEKDVSNIYNRDDYGFRWTIN